MLALGKSKPGEAPGSNPGTSTIWSRFEVPILFLALAHTADWSGTQ